MELLVDGILRRAARIAGPATAVSVGDASLTFAEVDAGADRWADALAGLAVGRHDRVAWWADSSLEAVPAFWGTARAGAVFAPLNPAFTADEAAVAAGYLRPSVLVTDPAHADAAAGLSSTLGFGVHVVGGGATATELDRMLARPPTGAAAGAVHGGEDPHAVFLTSGSTGRPKGVVLSHRTSWLRAFPGGGTFSANGGGGMATAFPQFHWAWWHYVMEAAHACRALHLAPATDGATLVATVERWRPSWLYLIPALWERVLSAPDGDLSSLRRADTGTSAFSLELLTAIKERLPGTSTAVFYGSTEAGRLAVLDDRDLFRKPGSVGPPAPPVEADIGPDGELRVRNPFLMSGYFDLPEETAAALRDGWYHTGDTAVADDEGYLTITGRVGEVIRSGGETISPAEVELAIRAYPGVGDVAVVGLPDGRWGEVVCAVLVLEAGATPPGVDQLHAHLEPRLARYKHPRAIMVTDRLPRTPATGQVQRQAVRRWVTEGAERQEANC